MAILFEFNHDKALQVINYLRNELEKRGKNLDIYKLVKLLYFADEYHINKYGRLICGGSYKTMDYGHVHSEMYDLVKTDNNEIVREGNNIKATKVKLDKDEFSESDIEALNFAIENFGHLSFKELKDESHKRKNWKDNHIFEGTSNSLPIDDIIESDEMKEYVKNWSKENQQFENWLINNYVESF